MLEKDKIFVSFQETNEGGVPIWPEFSDEIKDILNNKKKSNNILGNQLRNKIGNIQEKFGTRISAYFNIITDLGEKV